MSTETTPRKTLKPLDIDYALRVVRRTTEMRRNYGGNLHVELRCNLSVLRIIEAVLAEAEARTREH